MKDIYKIILEETLAGYWDWHIKENEIFLSPAFKAIFGYEDDELPNTIETWKRLIVVEDMDKVDKCLAAHFESGGNKIFNIDIRYKHKSNAIIWINATGRVIEWDNDKPLRMVGCHIDITGKKKTEQTLKISEATFRNAFEYSPIGMVLVSTDGKFLKVNKSICDLLGYTATGLLEKTFQEITHPDDLEADMSLLQKTLDDEISSYQMEKRYFTKSGSIIWILLHVSLVRNQSNEPLYFVSQIKDITERRNEEVALRESERRWIFASEGSGGGIWDWDLQNNTVFHSEQCIRMIGFEPHEFNNIPGVWTKRVHPDDKQKYLTDVSAYINGETKIYTNQHRVLCKDGTYKWILDRGKVIEYNENGRPARIIGTHTDITEQKQQEEQLRHTLDMVSGQNSRLLNFAYIISHNLRTHSSNFKMIMDILTDPVTDQSEKDELSGHLKKVSEQLNETIANLNEVVSIQTNIDIHTREINLHSYFSKAVELLQNDISRWEVEIDNRVPVDCTLVYNPAYMESIIFNLLSNAIKYRSLTNKPKIVVSYFNTPGGKHGFIIADNGIGIDLNKHGDQLFGMYKTFHGNRDAKGMGLFITKNQVESFGGSIAVTSEAGKGSTFTVFLN
ncbi:PAS domain S-box protein [Mucilaginibacter sp.]|jgi:PAS domain S-box-containing protein|uniref:PAS domain S-box protein n=1 Tax=Mucilaginibacter sp. TaxID=1882438 RepID=UPI003567F692